MSLFEIVKLKLKKLRIRKKDLLSKKFSFLELMDLKFLNFYVYVEKTYIDSRLLCIYKDVVYEVIKVKDENFLKLKEYKKPINKDKLLKVEKFFVNVYDLDEESNPNFSYLPRKKIEDIEEEDIKNFFNIFTVYAKDIKDLDKEFNFLYKYYIAYSNENKLIPFYEDDVDLSFYKEDAYLSKFLYRTLIKADLKEGCYIDEEDNIEEVSEILFNLRKRVGMFMNDNSLVAWSFYSLKKISPNKEFYEKVVKSYVLKTVKELDKRANDYGENLYRLVSNLRMNNLLTDKDLVNLLGDSFTLDMSIIKVLKDLDSNIIDTLDYVSRYNVDQLINTKDINRIIESDIVYKDIILSNIVKNKKFNNLFKGEEVERYYILLNLISYCVYVLKDQDLIFNNSDIDKDLYFKLKYVFNILGCIFNLKQDIRIYIDKDTVNSLSIFLLLEPGKMFKKVQKINSSSEVSLSTNVNTFYITDDVQFQEVERKYNLINIFKNKKFSLAYNLNLVKKEDLEVFEKTFITDLNYNNLTELLNMYINGSNLLKRQIENSEDFYLIKKDIDFIEGQY